MPMRVEVKDTPIVFFLRDSVCPRYGSSDEEEWARIWERNTRGTSALATVVDYRG